MDATQMICDSILESDEDEENADARAEAEPLASLRVFKNKHIPESVLPLYLGENVLGRDPSSCTLPLHAQSVSKQHTAVSISVFPANSRRVCASVEALVWDMGSMNGTRKGRLKLTPHVRYALSDGDNLMVADIPCQYSSYVDPGSVVNRGSVVARESQVTREDAEVHTNGHAEAPTRASFGERGEMMVTPARTKVLSFEQTPDQPEGSLVPQSDSDEERGGKDGRRKTLVFASDSPVTSPTCSTFLSPTNKVIPESEDESPITPSSSSKHHPTRCVSTDNDEQDFGAWQQQLKNQKAAQFNAIDGKEEKEEVSPEGPEPEKSEGCAPDSVSTWAEDGLDRPGPAPSSELIQVLSMDSDTDVEGEEESLVSVGPGSPNRTQPAPTPPTANAPSSQLGQFIMDSDTDEDDGIDASSATKASEANTTESPGDVLVAQQTDGDTDVEGHDDDDDDDDELDGVSKATHASPQSENTPVSWASSTLPPDFHLESDTDVEEEEEEEEEGDDAVAKSTPAKVEAESWGVVFASAAPPLDSDTDDDVLLPEVNRAPTSEAAPPTPALAADPSAHLDILSDSDTDVEDDSPLIRTAVAVAINAGPKSSSSSSGPISLAAALGPDSDTDTDVEEISSRPVGLDVSTDPADSRMDSDTDLEEEAREGGTAGGPVSCSSDEKDFGSVQGHRGSLQHCSTPVELSGGAVAEMETQEYLCPSIDPFKCPRVPGLRLMVSLSCSDSQGEDDFAVAETQSFIVAERDQQSSPSRNYTLDETQPFIPQGTSRHEDGLSDSLHLQAKAQALAMESTQAFILPDVNLEATQVYAPPPSLDGSSLELDSELEATQGYLGRAGSSGRSPGSGIKRPVDIALEATQAFIPESLSDVDAVEVNEVDTMDIASAETQLMDSPSGYTLAMAETQLMCELQEDGREQVEGEEARLVSLGTNCALSSAETQPMATYGDVDEDSVPAPRKRRARRLIEEEDTQVMTGSEPTAAGTQPAPSTSSDESQGEEDKHPVLKQIRSRNQRKLHSETSTRATTAGTAPDGDSDTAQQATGRPRRGRGRKPGAATSRGRREEEEEKEQEQEPQPQPSASLRSIILKGKASSSTRGGTGDVMPEEWRGEEEETEADQVRQGGRRTTRQPRGNAREKKERLERERKEQAENERRLQEQEEQEKMEQALREEEEKQRMERDQREKEERERLEWDREEMERLEVEEKERLERERKEQEEKERLERIQREKEEQERQEHEKKEREERVRLEMEQKESEQKAREEKERLEKEEHNKLEREMEERLEKEEQERLECEKKEREERLEKEEQERIENQRKGREEKARLEQIQKEEEERSEQERKEQEEMAREEQERLEKERELEETARLEHEKKELGEKERLQRDEKERERKELEEKERERKELEEKERERKELEEKERERKELEEKERERKELEEKERERKELEEKERERKELEEKERERKELEEKERERKELEEKERERKELEEKERLKREKREQERERLRREKDERHQKAALEQEEREKWRRAQEEEADRARLETEKRAREEMDRRDERERLLREALERQLLERQQTYTAQAQRGQQTPRTTRGRRATRTTTAALPEPAPETEHGPASRTRSRSNSSNSVSSERSASSATAQESGQGRGRGRGQGAKKTHPQSVGAGTSARESRRCRTVTGDTPGESSDLGRSTRSRSHSTDSLSSEVSACSGPPSRGRGAGRGRGRKTLPAPETNPQPSSSGQSEVAPAPRAPARGRRTKGPDATAVDGGGDGEEEPVSQPAATTRGLRRTNAAQPGPVGAEEQEGTPEDSTLVARSTAGRGRGRRAQVKAKPAVAPVAVDRTDGGEDNGSGRAKGVGELESEPKEKKPTPVRRGRGFSAQGNRNPNDPPTQEMLVKEEDEEETITRKVRRGRQSVAKKEKNEEVVGEGMAPAPQVVERDAGTSEVTQTPTGKSSRKRGAAPAEASPLAKSPRASLASPGARLRTACQPYKVLFTGLVDEVGEEVVVRLGGSLALGVSDMTHLVTDKVRRTVKFLCAMARGIPVVTTQWLEKSAKAGSFLSPSAYIVKDMEQEQKFNFRLQESIRIASIQPLLQGYQIHVTKSVKPEPTHMLDIISCCGASFLAKMPSSHKEQTVVVSCEEDWLLCGPALAASLPVVSAEFLLTGILQQKADLEAHALPSAPATTIPPQPARGRGRRRT